MDRHELIPMSPKFYTMLSLSYYSFCQPQRCEVYIYSLLAEHAFRSLELLTLKPLEHESSWLILRHCICDLCCCCMHGSSYVIIELTSGQLQHAIHKSTINIVNIVPGTVTIMLPQRHSF